MNLPSSLDNKLRKLYTEQITNYRILYKCRNCSGVGFLSEGYEKGKVEIYQCEKCHGIGKLYFFELVMYPKYFDERDFYL